MRSRAQVRTILAAIQPGDGMKQVALNGTVPNYPQYLEAAAAAQRIAGVTDVHNHLEVVLSDSDYRDDAMLTTAANNAMTLNVTVPAGIEAAARDGNLTLTGAAWMASGVFDVRDDLYVTG
jgi:osmotically-inducible protein OsmY